METRGGASEERKKSWDGLESMNFEALCAISGRVRTQADGTYISKMTSANLRQKAPNLREFVSQISLELRQVRGSVEFRSLFRDAFRGHGDVAGREPPALKRESDESLGGCGLPLDPEGGEPAGPVVQVDPGGHELLRGLWPGGQ